MLSLRSTTRAVELGFVISMACSYADFAEPTNPDVVNYLEGRGRLLSKGLEPLKVQYELFVGKMQSGFSGYALLRGNPDALHVRWLIPDIQLRLEEGRRLDFSITELHGGIAHAEMVDIPKWLLPRRHAR
jgi:hypothetical protein